MTNEVSESTSRSIEQVPVCLVMSVSLPEIVTGLVEEGEKAATKPATGPVPQTIFQEPRFRIRK